MPWSKCSTENACSIFKIWSCNGAPNPASENSLIYSFWRVIIIVKLHLIKTKTNIKVRSEHFGGIRLQRICIPKVNMKDFSKRMQCHESRNVAEKARNFIHKQDHMLLFTSKNCFKSDHLDEFLLDLDSATLSNQLSLLFIHFILH